MRLANKVDRKGVYASGIWESAEEMTLTSIPATISQWPLDGELVERNTAQKTVLLVI